MLQRRVIVDPQCPEWNEREIESFLMMLDMIKLYEADPNRKHPESFLRPAAEATGALLQYCFPWEFK